VEQSWNLDGLLTAGGIERGLARLQRRQSLLVHEGHHGPILNKINALSDSFHVGNQPPLQTHFIVDKAPDWVPSDNRLNWLYLDSM